MPDLPSRGPKKGITLPKTIGDHAGGVIGSVPREQIQMQIVAEILRATGAYEQLHRWFVNDLRDQGTPVHDPRFGKYGLDALRELFPEFQETNSIIDVTGRHAENQLAALERPFSVAKDRRMRRKDILTILHTMIDVTDANERTFGAWIEEWDVDRELLEEIRAAVAEQTFPTLALGEQSRTTRKVVAPSKYYADVRQKIDLTTKEQIIIAYEASVELKELMTDPKNLRMFDTFNPEALEMWFEYLKEILVILESLRINVGGLNAEEVELLFDAMDLDEWLVELKRELNSLKKRLEAVVGRTFLEKFIEWFKSKEKKKEPLSEDELRNKIAETGALVVELRKQVRYLATKKRSGGRRI